MEECSETQLSLKLDHEQEAFAVLLYTPMCGTCKLAERMLNIIEAMKPGISLYKSNMNALFEFGQAWKIQSVPCLLILDKGELIRKVYAMESVDHLYKLLQPLYNNHKSM